MPILATTTLDKNMHFKSVTGSGHEVSMDAVPAVGGENLGPRPAELPYVGLSGCTGMDVISILRKMRQEVKSFKIEVEGIKRAEEHPKVWLETKVTFIVEGELDQAKLEKAINLSRTRYCSVSAQLKPGMKINYSYILNGEATDLSD